MCVRESTAKTLFIKYARAEQRVRVIYRDYKIARTKLLSFACSEMV